MKKKIAVLLLLALMMLSVAGCSPAATAYMADAQKVTAWNAATSEQKGTIDIAADGQTMQIAMTVTSYVEQSPDRGVIDIKFAPIAGTDLDGLDITLPNMKMYVDGATVYLPKSYFTALSAMSGAENPLLAEIDAEYIAISDTSAMGVSPAMLDYLSSPAFNSDITALLNKAFQGYKAPIAMTHSGNTYTLTATSDQLIDLLFGGFDHLINNLDLIADDVVKLANALSPDAASLVTKEALQELKKDYNKDDIAAFLPDAKAYLQGSTLTISETFAPEKYTSDIKMLVNIADENVKVTANFTATSNKVAKDAKFALPTSVKKVTSEEYLALLMGGIEQGPTAYYIFSEEQNISAFTSTGVVDQHLASFIHEKSFYLHFGALTYALGAEHVAYDANAHVASFTLDGTAYTIAQPKLVDGVPYVSVDQLIKAGLNADGSVEGEIASATIYVGGTPIETTTEFAAEEIDATSSATK